MGPVAGQAVAAAPTGAREAGVTHCLAVVAKEALWTHAQVDPTTVLTPASVLAGAGGTGVHLCFAVDSSETIRTLADEGPGEVPAGAAIPAGLCSALVCLSFTVDSFVPWAAEALVPSSEVLAGASMQAWLRLALIHFSALGRLAPDTLWLADTHMAEGTQAEAAVTRVQGHRAHVSSIEAHGSMLHLLRATAVHLCLTPVSCVPWLAVAEEICSSILTGTPIHTWAPEAGGGSYLAVTPREAWRAVTLVFANIVKASATVVTGTRGTGVWLSNLTVSPGEAIRAGAVVLIVRLFACAPVPAGT